MAFAGKLLGSRSIEAQVVFCSGDVHGGSYGNRLAVVPGFGLGQHVRVRGDFVCEPHEHCPSLGGFPSAPSGKGFACGGHGGLYIFCARSRDSAVNGARCRLHIVQPLPAQGRDTFTVDEIEDVLFHRLPLGTTRWGRKEKDRSLTCRSSCGCIDSCHAFRGCPTRTRTLTNGTKNRCATITPWGIPRRMSREIKKRHHLHRKSVGRSRISRRLWGPRPR